MWKLIMASLFLGSPLLIGGQAANAGLGSASSSATTVFDAWCGEKGNDCVVEFGDERITVDGEDSISFDQITGYSFDKVWKYRTGFTGGSYYLKIFHIYYTEDGRRQSGKILFENDVTASEFKAQLSNACGRGRCRPLGPSVIIEK